MSKTKKEQSRCFELKADFFPLTVLRLSNSNMDAIEAQLNQTIDEAPKYLTHAPLVIDVNDIQSSSAELDIASLCDTLRAKKIIPVGIRGLSENDQAMANAHGLALLKSGKTPSTSEQTTKETPKRTYAKTKIINKPVRAGTQIYAKDADLIVLTSVNAGAECIADGNIHIYGALRGRALAGASGDPHTHIFCKTLDAELIAIAGHYLINEDIKPLKTKHSMIQVSLKDNNLQIDGI